MKKKNPDVALSNVFIFRMSKRDRAALNALAKANDRSPSDYLRTLILSQIQKSLDDPTFMQNYRPFLEQDAKELREVFDNIKQLGEQLKAAGVSGHIVLGEEDGTSYEVDL